MPHEPKDMTQRERREEIAQLLALGLLRVGRPMEPVIAPLPGFIDAAAIAPGAAQLSAGALNQPEFAEERGSNLAPPFNGYGT